MSLSQVLAPQLQQSLALLQAPTLELKALVEQELQQRQTQLTEENTTTQTFLSQLQDTDMAQAITQYQQLQTALEASYETAARSLGVSLIDFLQ